MLGDAQILSEYLAYLPRKEKMGSNDWQLYLPMHKLQKRLVMIDMISFREEDGLAKMKLKLPYNDVYRFLLFMGKNSVSNGRVCTTFSSM